MKQIFTENDFKPKDTMVELHNLTRTADDWRTTLLIHICLSQFYTCPMVTVIKLSHSDSYQTVPQWQLSNCCQRPTAVAVSHECREDNSYQARQLTEKRHHGYSPKCVSTINSSPFNFKARSHLTRHIHSSQHNTNKRVRAEKEDWKPHMK